MDFRLKPGRSAISPRIFTKSNTLWRRNRWWYIVEEVVISIKICICRLKREMTEPSEIKGI
jgi:hypothetical protein